jgi:hypothetical protein
MDQRDFDTLTRSAVAEVGTRRVLLRLLAGGALGGLVARLGLSESATAKAKKKRKQRTSKAEPKQTSALQAEGKRKKRRGKNRNNRPQCDELAVPLCGACEEPLCVAGDWACKAIGDTDCGNGVCVWDGECCPDKYRCDDGTCVDPLDECCPEQKPCPGGSCVGADECCPGQKTCPGYAECFAEEDCCPGALPPLCAECDKVVCEGGDLVCRPKSVVCSYPEDQEVCCNGDLVCRGHRDLPERCVTYTPERTYNPGNCRCKCPPDTNDSLGFCCPWDYPTASPVGDGSCYRWEDCGGYQCSRSVCALGFSRNAQGLCRRTT